VFTRRKIKTSNRSTLPPRPAAVQRADPQRSKILLTLTAAEQYYSDKLNFILTKASGANNKRWGSRKTTRFSLPAGSEASSICEFFKKSPAIFGF
jgi:hypothetical protein